ncbi:hypothetical protein FBU30_010324 [Linnemannia zychae]|nr:hypothetical protein FBU30_010324 [Linnemannia zychae]
MDENHDSYESMEEEVYDSMEEDNQFEYEEMENNESLADMEIDSIGDEHTPLEDWENRDNILLREDEGLNSNNSNVWVYTKHLQVPGSFQQICLGQWTPNDPRTPTESGPHCKPHSTEVVLGKLTEIIGRIQGSYISLCRFTENETEQPSGSWETIYEQPIFGHIKDLKTVLIDFEYEEHGTGHHTDTSCYNEKPRIGYLPETVSKSLLVATSDTGLLTFLAFHCSNGDQKLAEHGRFYAVKMIDITKPGHDTSELGAKIAIDPMNNVMAVSSIDANGTIIDMDFLYVDSNSELVIAILGVLYYSQDTERYYISTFHIGPASQRHEPSIYIGTSEIRSAPLLSVTLLKGLPELPYCMVYIDEESITYVTTEQLTTSTGTTTINHTHHKPLNLMKKETKIDRNPINDDSELENSYPLISACTTPPKLEASDGYQSIYLASDTGDLFRVRINGHNNKMHFELCVGGRPIGQAMGVITRNCLETDAGSTNEHIIAPQIDYLLYSSECGSGGILGIKETDKGIGVYAISELPNDAPVLDFCIDEPRLPGRDSLFTCSGMKSEGCIKRIRSGIVVESSGTSGQQQFNGATGIWSVKTKRNDPVDSFLVISFIQSTKLMRVGNEGELEDISENCGLELSHATISAGRLLDGTLFQVHRTGVVAICQRTGQRYKWSQDGVLASACLAKEGTLVLGQIVSGISSLVVLELEQTSDDSKSTPVSYSFRVITSKPMSSEPTTIYCWSSVHKSGELGAYSAEVQCCVGTLEPAIYVFLLNRDSIDEIFKEPLTQVLGSGAVPHSISVLRNNKGLQRLLIGLRNGSVIVYEWDQQKHLDYPLVNSSTSERIVSLPRLFNLGIMPVDFAYSDEFPSSKALILSDNVWQISLDNEFGIQPVLSDIEVSQACTFMWRDSECSIKLGFVFIVAHRDIQLITLEEKRRYDSQSLSLGQTPRRLLDITSEGLLLAATVGDGFPFAQSTLHLIDPARASSESETEKQHVVAELTIKQGEGVYCLAGTGIFSPNGAAATAASPRTGRLLILSIKHSKMDGYKLVEEWALDMPLPVFAISPFIDKLLEKASVRERWPIVQISTQNNTIVTGSRGESINFYEYEAGSSDSSFDKLKFFRSARSARQISDCLAISPELAVGVDLSGGVFGVGYTPGVINQQYSLFDQFSFHVGEIVTRLRLSKLWMDEDERSLCGISLSKCLSTSPLQTSILSSPSSSPSLSLLSSPLDQYSSSFASLLRIHILVPWTPIDTTSASVDEYNNDNHQLSEKVLTSSPSSKTHPSPQALVGYTVTGSILGFWRLNPPLYNILKTLQNILATHYESRPVLGTNHPVFRGLSTRTLHTIDGDLVNQFLDLDHYVQIEIMDCAIRLEGMVEEWIQQCDSSTAKVNNSSIGELAAALNRETMTKECHDKTTVATTCTCIDYSHVARSLHSNEKSRPQRWDYRGPVSTVSTIGIQAQSMEFGKGDENEQNKLDEGEGVKAIEVSRRTCRTIHVLCTVLLFLRNLDWHQ